MKHFLLLALVLLLVVGVGVFVFVASQGEPSESESEEVRSSTVLISEPVEEVAEEVADEVAEEEEETTSSSSEAVSVVEDGIRTFDIEVYQWGYEPKLITLQPEETVKFRLTSRDVTHTFSVALDDGVANFVVHPGSVNEAEFTAPATPGDYKVGCNIQCGVGHFDMSGIIRVE